MSCTTDMWTDEYKQHSFSAVTIHWVDEDGQLRSRVLSTQEFPSSLPKTGVNIKQHLTEIFDSFGISPAMLQRVVFTTDRGSNIVYALRDDERIDCINHVLNRVIQHALEVKHAPKALTTLITAVKELVRFVKKSSLQDLLKKTLKQSCATRWNSIYYMLMSVLEAYDDLRTLLALHKSNELHRLTAIPMDLLKEVVDFLGEFAAVTKACEGQSEPTLHLVIPKMARLKKHCMVII